MTYKNLAIVVAAVVLLGATEARANAILTIGNVPQVDENILLNTGDIGNPIFGTTNSTGLMVRFTGNEQLTAPANGQARIEAADDLFTYLMVDLPSGSFTSLIVNLDAKTVEVGGQRVHLTGKEYQMLELLSLRKGTTLTKEMFLNHLYGGMDEPELKIIDVFICKLRKKLATATNGDNYIETVWGRGYVLRDPNEDSRSTPAEATAVSSPA